MAIEVTKVEGAASAMELHERARDAGCFSFITELWYVDDRVEPVHVRAIREVYPNYVPLKCRRVFRTPAGTDEIVDYHVIGMYMPNVQDGYEDDYIRLEAVPRGFPFPANRIQPLRVLAGEWEKGSVESRQAAPAPPVQFGPWVIEQMRSIRKFFDGAIRIEGESVGPGDFRADKMLEVLQAQQRRDDEIMQKASEEARYRMRESWKQMREALEAGRIVDAPKDVQPYVFQS